MTHRSTVLIVTPEQTRSVEVNTRLLLSMRPLLMGLGAVIVALLGALAAIGWGYWGQRQAQSEHHDRDRKSVLPHGNKQFTIVFGNE